MWRADSRGGLRPTIAVRLAILLLASLAGASSAKLCTDTKAASLKALTAKCTQLSTMNSILSNIPAKAANNMLNCTGEGCGTAVRTVFVPSDQAWQTYFAQYGTTVESLTSDSASARAALLTLLSNHVIAANLARFVAGGPNATFTTLASTTAAPLRLVVKRLPSGQLDVLGSFSEAHALDEGIVLYGNQQFTAYTIDAVLAVSTPPSRSPSRAPPPSPQPRPSPVPPASRRRRPPPSPPPPPAVNCGPNVTLCPPHIPNACSTNQICANVTLGGCRVAGEAPLDRVMTVPACLSLISSSYGGNLTRCSLGDPSTCPAGQYCRNTTLPLYLGGIKSGEIAMPTCSSPAFNYTACNAGADMSGCPAGQVCRRTAMAFDNVGDAGYEHDYELDTAVCLTPRFAYSKCSEDDPGSCPSGQFCKSVWIWFDTGVENDWFRDLQEFACTSPSPAFINTTKCTMGQPGACPSGQACGNASVKYYLDINDIGDNAVAWTYETICVSMPTNVTACTAGTPNTCPTGQLCLHDWFTQWAHDESYHTDMKMAVCIDLRGKTLCTNDAQCGAEGVCDEYTGIGVNLPSSAPSSLEWTTYANEVSFCRSCYQAATRCNMSAPLADRNKPCGAGQQCALVNSYCRGMGGVGREFLTGVCISCSGATACKDYHLWGADPECPADKPFCSLDNVSCSPGSSTSMARCMTEAEVDLPM